MNRSCSPDMRVGLVFGSAGRERRFRLVPLPAPDRPASIAACALASRAKPASPQVAFVAEQREHALGRIAADHAHAIELEQREAASRSASASPTMIGTRV